jgi:hypothetical protein
VLPEGAWLCILNTTQPEGPVVAWSKGQKIPATSVLVFALRFP